MTNDHLTKRKVPLLVTLSGLVGLLLILCASTTRAQQRFSFGVSAGGGTSQLSSSISSSSSGYVRFSTAQPFTYSLSAQLGTYVRYSPIPQLFVQSGAYYQYDYGSLPLHLETDRFILDEEGHPRGVRSEQEYMTAGYQFHQMEVPLLLGVVLFQHLRMYAGPSWGFSLDTRTSTRTSAPYRYRNDPVFRNLRLGAGTDLGRFTVDFFWQGTLRNDSYFRACKSLPDPAIGASETSIGYHNFSLSKVMVTLGYRLR